MKRRIWTTLLIGLTLTSVASATMMRQEWWDDVALSRQAIIDLLVDLVNPVPVPDLEEVQAASEFSGARDNYVAKFYGWVTVPETGTYQFHYACDDYGMLYVSQDAKMANAVEVAYVDGWCAVDEWNKYTTQHSVAMELKKGQTMAVMAFFMEDGGGDNMDLGWTGPGLSSDITNPTYLTDYITHIAPDPSRAKGPVPEIDAEDVPLDAMVSWTIGESAATHDVYIGTVFDDVNDASRDDPRGLLLSQSQADATFDLEGVTEFGQTYYWRIDEVNGAPDYTIFKGKVWTFTAEPFAYPITNVTAAASSQQPASPASNTINGSGLDEFDQHSVELKQMWVTPGGLPAWIQYTFDKEYKLYELWVWNANSELESFMGFGAKGVTIEYSVDGETWAQLENVPEFGQGTGTATYKANTIVDLGGVMAKYVKLTINTTYGYTGMTSLSEVRFLYVPVQAFGSDPADGATGVSIDATLNWRAGREATSHQVYFGTDATAVADGTAAAETATEHSYTPSGMDFGTMYYWKVDEAGDAGTYAGDVWSFTSQEYKAVEDFDSYTNDIEAGTTIWQTWTDGMSSGASGSQVGYDDSPFAEQTTIHSGRQSMPLAYDNDGTFREGTQYERTGVPFYSEAEREFDPVQNWTGNGATHVSLWAQGYPAPMATTVTETGGKMNVTGAGADIWNNSDEFTYAYKTLTGDGSLIARVVSIGPGSNTWSKGGVMIRDSLNGGSTHASMVLTANTDGAAGNGASFQYRPATDGASSNVDSTSVIAAPYWVKIERIGDTLTGYTSADGKTWAQKGTTAIAMKAPVYIGLCVTSHAAGEDRTFQSDSIATTGSVSAAWQGVVIDKPQYNDAANLSLTIVDSAGKSATVTNATLAMASTWTLWSVPMSDFAGVNFAKVKKIVITIGDKTATTAGGSGIVFIDDIGFGRAAQ
ncbi:MAG: discoidin domain-containing protein [Phycisphaerales bacterium]